MHNFTLLVFESQPYTNSQMLQHFQRRQVGDVAAESIVRKIESFQHGDIEQCRRRYFSNEPIVACISGR